MPGVRQGLSRGRPRPDSTFDGAAVDPGRRLDGSLYLTLPYLEVRAESDVTGFAWGGEHAFAGEGLQELGWVVDGDEDEVGLGFSGIVAGLSQSCGEVASPFVVLGQPVYVVLEGVEGGGGDEAGLAHAAAEGLAGSARLTDGRFVTSEQ